MVGLDEKTQREVVLTRLAIHKAAGVSGRGILTVVSLSGIVLSVVTTAAWMAERARNHDLNMRLIELSRQQDESEPALQPISGDVVESVLMQWVEWRYARVKATINADYGKVQYFLSPDLNAQFVGHGESHYNAGWVVAKHERGTDPDVTAKADAIELVEHLRRADGQGDTYRYHVMLTLRAEQGRAEYKRLAITVRTLSDREFRQRFRAWEETVPGAGVEFRKFNGGSRIEITAISESDDHARAALVLDR